MENYSESPKTITEDLRNQNVSLRLCRSLKWTWLSLLVRPEQHQIPEFYQSAVTQGPHQGGRAHVTCRRIRGKRVGPEKVWLLEVSEIRSKASFWCFHFSDVGFNSDLFPSQNGNTWNTHMFSIVFLNWLWTSLNKQNICPRLLACRILGGLQREEMKGN